MRLCAPEQLRPTVTKLYSFERMGWNTMKKKLGIVTAAGVLLLLSGMLASVYIGAKNIPVNEIYHALFQNEGTLNDMLVRDVRLPRMLCAVLTGGMLALTGTMMQGVMRNPIAEPSVMPDPDAGADREAA